IAMQRGRGPHCAPLTVGGPDHVGHLEEFKREGRWGILRQDVAEAKACGALGIGFGSRELADRAQRMPMFVNALAAVSGGRLVPVPGGVLIKNDAGEVLGAVGISGDTSDKDEACAVAGIEAAKLTPVTGA